MHEVLIDDLVHVVPVDVRVPDGLRVHDQYRPLLAAIKTTRLVYADLAGTRQTQFFDALLRIVAGFLSAVIVAASLAGLALVTTEEYVMLVIAHDEGGAALYGAKFEEAQYARECLTAVVREGIRLSVGARIIPGRRGVRRAEVGEAGARRSGGFVVVGLNRALRGGSVELFQTVPVAVYGGKTPAVVRREA
jgi:hypothetical protein